ncbi:hypothetical protein B0H14DRAFT_690177 [Mycena olivaceomarginata]|nr:hypothetical protein B0H14DRAFT_690177 [Mycena olivaceomarginata]
MVFLRVSIWLCHLRFCDQICSTDPEYRWVFCPLPSFFFGLWIKYLLATLQIPDATYVVARAQPGHMMLNRQAQRSGVNSKNSVRLHEMTLLAWSQQ